MEQSEIELFFSDHCVVSVPCLDPLSGRLINLEMMPMQIKRLQTVFAGSADIEWLMEVLNREGRRFGTRVVPTEKGFLKLVWD